VTAFIVDPLAGDLAGRVRVPGDKSIGHRAVMLGAISSGVVEVTGLSQGADNGSTLAAIEQLGVAVERVGLDSLKIHGRGLRGLIAPRAALDCGNAGTGMRLLCGILAGQSFDCTLVGDESLSVRPMKRVTVPLGLMGAQIDGQERDGNIYPPLTVRGDRALHGIRYQSPVASAQVKSAVLLAGLYASGETEVVEPGSSRDHTEIMLEYLGADIVRPEARSVRLRAPQELVARPLMVPGDPSSAAFAVVAGLVTGAGKLVVEKVCLNPTRTGFVDALLKMGAPVSLEPGESASEKVGELAVRGAGAPMTGVEISGDLTVRAIDELPILAVAAAFAEGETVFADAGELRVKESDRIATTVAMLRGFGVDVEENKDGFTVAGQPGRTLEGARIDSAGDHRIAMAAAVAALRANGQSRIDDVDNVATSFPSFVEVFSALGASIRRA
jgi:3-phosphoshikimate 1-carboxyvinyltransferase